MKKLFVICLMAFIGLGVSAQSKGEMAAGLNLAYGTSDGINNLGIGAKFQYNFTDALRIEPSANYFFRNNFISLWEANVNAHWIFKFVDDKLGVYPIAGVTVLGYKASYLGYSTPTYTRFGANVGAGAQYWITDHIGVNADIKYSIVADIDRPVFAVGAVYKF